MQLLAKSSPKLAEELVPGLVSLSTLLKVLQALLQEQVPVRDIRTIAEAIANVAPKSQDPAAMVAAVRVSPVSYTHLDVYKRQGQDFAALQTPLGKDMLLQQALASVQELAQKETGSTVVEQVLFTNFVLQ